MIGLTFGFVGSPFWPWHVAHFCAFASMSSAAYAGTAVTAKTTPAPKIIEKRRVNIAIFLPPVTAHGTRQRHYPNKAQDATGARHTRLPRSALQKWRPSLWNGLVLSPKRMHDTQLQRVWAVPVTIPNGAQGQGNQRNSRKGEPDAKQTEVGHHHLCSGDVVLSNGAECQSARSGGPDRYGTL